MRYRDHNPPAFLLVGYDPHRDLPADHLARLVEFVVEEAELPRRVGVGPGQPGFDPRLCAKVLVYGYATGVRSSRQLERMCAESLPYLFLTRGDTPSYRTLASFRVQQSALIEQIWIGLFAVAGECGMQRLGRIVIDSSKIRADVSPEAVVQAREYAAVTAQLQRILAEAEAADHKDEADPPGTTCTGHPVETQQMRDILRRVRKHLAAPHPGDLPASEGPPQTLDQTKGLGPRMLARIKRAIATLQEAEQTAQKHACLTDPDARMMGEGREKRVRACHSFEVVVDKEDGLLVVGQTCQSAVDNPRLKPLVEAAQAQEPHGVSSVDADSGYYSGDSVGALLEAGIDPCIPDSNTAGDLHRGQPIGTVRASGHGQVPLVYDAEADCFGCPAGNRLTPAYKRVHCGQEVVVYRAQKPCSECPQAPDCLSQPDAKYRQTYRGEYTEALEAARQRFGDADHQARYHHRGEVVESVFGFLRGTLGYRRFLLRGKERVASEATLFKTAYQLRKVHRRWATRPS
jgi:transposase